MRGSRGSGAASQAIIRRKAPRHSKNSAVATPWTRTGPWGFLFTVTSPSPPAGGGRALSSDMAFVSNP